jgi:hypothetical protein
VWGRSNEKNCKVKKEQTFPYNLVFSAEGRCERGKRIRKKYATIDKKSVIKWDVYGASHEKGV